MKQARSGRQRNPRDDANVSGKVSAHFLEPVGGYLRISIGEKQVLPASQPG